MTRRQAGKKAPKSRPAARKKPDRRVKPKAPRSPAPLAVRAPAAISAPAEEELLEPRLPDARAATGEVLARLRSLETLEDAYVAWGELRALHASAKGAWAAERERIEVQGEFLLGAVRAARAFSSSGAEPGALARAGEVDGFIADTTARLEAARGKLASATGSSEALWGQALAEARATVISRVERTVKLARPSMRLLLRSLAGNRRILHLERLSGDAPVLVHAVLSGCVPSRYDYLFDDSTDDVAQAPPSLFAEEGVGPGELRAPPARLLELHARAQGVFPSKGMIPFRVVQPAATLYARFLQRGPVAEAEVKEGEGWRSVLSVEEAEVIAGWLIKLQLEGKLSVALARG